MQLEDYFEYYLKTQQSQNIITNNRAKIKEQLEPLYDNGKISARLVKKCFELIDSIWFSKSITKKLQQVNKSLKFFVGTKIKRIAGYVLETRDLFKIKISSFILDNLFNADVQAVEIGGIITHDLLSVLIILMEHEITHLIIMLLRTHKLNVIKEKSGHTVTFKTLVYNMYRQTRVTHNLLLGDVVKFHEATSKARAEISVGDRVLCKKNNRIGIIIEIRSKVGVFHTGARVDGCLLKDLEIIKKSENVHIISDIKKKFTVGDSFDFSMRGKLITFKVVALRPSTLLAEDASTGKKMYFKYWAFITSI